MAKGFAATVAFIPSSPFTHSAGLAFFLKADKRALRVLGVTHDDGGGGCLAVTVTVASHPEGGHTCAWRRQTDMWTRQRTLAIVDFSESIWN